MYVQSEAFSKEIENIKKKKRTEMLDLKNSISKTKNVTEHQQQSKANGRPHSLEDKNFGITLFEDT